MTGEPLPTDGPGSEDNLRRIPAATGEKAPPKKGHSHKGGFWQSKYRLWGTFGTIGILVVSFITGIAVYWGDSAEAKYQHVEVYLTDLPANFTRLEVRLSGVYVGDANHSLKLDQASFDLLSLRGPQDALLVASGDLPPGNHTTVRIVFAAVRAQLNGLYMTLKIPDAVLSVHHDFGLAASDRSAFLFDLNVDKSIAVTSKGLVFSPFVESIYVHAYDPAAGLSSGPAFERAAFQEKSPEPPKRQTVNPDDGKTAPRRSSGSFNAPATTTFNWNPGGTVTTTTATSAADPGPGNTNESSPPLVNVGTLPDAQPEDPFADEESPDQLVHRWFVQFWDQVTWFVNDTTGVSVEDQVEIVESVGAEYVFSFASVPAAMIEATADEAMMLADHPAVKAIEEDNPIVMMVASSKTAIRLPELLNPITGLKDAQGRTIDGTGVGVALVDTGVDGLHPDLPHRLVQSTNPLLAVNYKVESLFSADVPNSDTTSGHGTHVAGILAGRGVQDPTQRGVAPGIRMYAFGVGELDTTLWTNQALDWIVSNHNKVSPPIKVVSNSWGSGNAYNPNSLTTTLVNKLVQAGVTVVFSAGNQGGNGQIAATSSQCQIPTPGVICVAAYDDGNIGSRDGTIAPYSARGLAASAATWPDVSAPGTSIRSTTTPWGFVTGIGLFAHYTELSGTSMSAPHVSGVAALVLQARPGLSPAQVESVVKDTAYKFTNGGAYDPATGSHFAKGTGLLDAYAAVQRAQTL